MNNTKNNEDKFLKLISNLELKTSLFIVSCTKEKIWEYEKDAQNFICAKKAYRGEDFIYFLNLITKYDLENKNFNWIIFSGKYGFIEPEHPIAYYDVYLGNPNQYPISLETLQNQARQMRWWRDNRNNFKKIKLINFKKIVCVNCDLIYIKSIKKCFKNHELLFIKDIREY